VAAALKQLWSAGGFKSTDVILGMGNQRVLARDLTVPKMSLARIRESLPFEVQEMLPVPVAEAVLDFYPIAETTGENGPMVRGLLIAAVKQAVLANVNATQLAGLTTVDVDLIPFALSRVLLSRPGVVGTVALVDIGASTTSVVIATDGVPQFVRIIATGEKTSPRRFFETSGARASPPKP
jgi:type IV pilus assembly protein PilM